MLTLDARPTSRAVRAAARVTLGLMALLLVAAPSARSVRAAEPTKTGPAFAITVGGGGEPGEAERWLKSWKDWEAYFDHLLISLEAGLPSVVPSSGVSRW